MLSFPRETVEYLPLTAQVDGEATETFEVAVVPHGQRPTTWSPHPYLLDTPEPGYYDAYTRVVDAPETPVVLAGSFIVT